eukprot:GHRR01029198.1.p1 GENE.GHRR01029198.1~~GHRR01029198.1.p1  ORF type:complete len:115 (-),score=13.28 GHRR01029198.1:320-664(-)
MSEVAFWHASVPSMSHKTGPNMAAAARCMAEDIDFAKWFVLPDCCIRITCVRFTAHVLSVTYCPLACWWQRRSCWVVTETIHQCAVSNCLFVHGLLGRIVTACFVQHSTVIGML